LIIGDLRWSGPRGVASTAGAIFLSTPVFYRIGLVLSRKS
jgi:hypothetical protein